MKCTVILMLVIASVNAQSCYTPLGVRSNCISLYDCSDLVKAFEERPLPSSTVNFLRKSQCGFEGYVPRVCCGPLPRQEKPSRPDPPPPRPNRPSTGGGRDPTSSEDSQPASRNECGLDTNGDRIYGGQITEIDEFPWMALLGYRTREGSITYQCGGVLINHRYVLTAAHCVTGDIERVVGTLVTVRLGEYDTQTDVDCMEVKGKSTCADPPQEIPVHQALAHSGYADRNKNRKDDIALVRLAKRAKYTYYVQPICLSDSTSRLDVGDDVFVAGWGKTLSGGNSPIKLKLNMPIFNKNECVTKYNTLQARLTEKQICAGGVFAQDSCRGDSGGPLMQRKPDGIWETVAIVSFGNGCGRDGWPGVYTSVASYRNWIDSTMRASNV